MIKDMRKIPTIRLSEEEEVKVIKLIHTNDDTAETMISIARTENDLCALSLTRNGKIQRLLISDETFAKLLMSMIEAQKFFEIDTMKIIDEREKPVHFIYSDNNDLAEDHQRVSAEWFLTASYPTLIRETIKAIQKAHEDTQVKIVSQETFDNRATEKYFLSCASALLYYKSNLINFTTVMHYVTQLQPSDADMLFSRLEAVEAACDGRIADFCSLVFQNTSHVEIPTLFDLADYWVDFEAWSTQMISEVLPTINELTNKLES